MTVTTKNPYDKTSGKRAAAQLERLAENKGKSMSVDEATKHATACVALLDAGKLAEALAYCAAQRVDPPQCSLTAESPNAHKLRIEAMDHLADEAWWRKRLAVGAKRDAEMQRMKLQRQG
jgi:hypothetical protein